MKWMNFQFNLINFALYKIKTIVNPVRVVKKNILNEKIFNKSNKNIKPVKTIIHLKTFRIKEIKNIFNLFSNYITKGVNYAE